MQTRTRHAHRLKTLKSVKKSKVSYKLSHTRHKLSRSEGIFLSHLKVTHVVQANLHMPAPPTLTRTKHTYIKFNPTTQQYYTYYRFASKRHIGTSPTYIEALTRYNTVKSKMSQPKGESEAGKVCTYNP